MKLSDEDAKLFYKLNPSLLLYVNNKLRILDKIKAVNDIIKASLDDKVKIRNELWKNIKCIDLFVSENPFRFSESELDIVKKWKHFISDDFYIIKHLKNYSIFLQEEPLGAYGVLGITNEIQEIVADDLPIYARAVLIPFKDMIIFDGFISTHSIHFGRNIRSDINDSFQRAKVQHGIITTLPVVEVEKKAVDHDAESLRFYLKNQRNRDMYAYEISDLVGRSPRLMTLYHHEMGKVHTRHYVKEFKKMGLKSGWFVILQGLIVASGLTKEEAVNNMKKVTPVDKIHWVTIFQFKG